MNHIVLDMLARGRAAPLQVSPVDAVMGDDWGIVDFGGGGAARQMMRQSLMTAHNRDIAPSGSPMPSTVPGYSAQAVVKMVRSGGARNAAGLKAQMDYLGRQGDVTMHRSERYMGIEIDSDEMSRMISGWNMPTDGRGKSDRTSHFIVSFPRETGVAAAERAGRAWAEEMFGSGNYGGDTFDYYTAFHTDRDHPHTHVIVYRRGLDNGTWLKVSQRSDFNYQAMRDLAVQVGRDEGIVLEATPRLARGAWLRPVPDAEYRRAHAEGREAKAPEHTPITAARAAAAIIYYARRFTAEAKILEPTSPAVAGLLRDTADAIAHGTEVSEKFHKIKVSAKEIVTMNDRVEAARAEVAEKFQFIDQGLAAVEDDAARMQLLREIAVLKAEVAPYMDQPGLKDYLVSGDTDRYEGMVPNNSTAEAVRLEADKEVREIAAKYGVNPDATVERYSGGRPSKALSEQYAAAEAAERDQTRRQSGAAEETAEQRDEAFEQMHREIRKVYLSANEKAVESTHEGVSAQPEVIGKVEGSKRYSVSLSATGEVQEFSTAREAGAAFADADAKDLPSVREVTEQGVRRMAGTVRVGDEQAKSVPSLQSVLADPAETESDREFWSAYHERVERQLNSQEQAARRDQSDATSAEVASTGVREDHADQDRFDIPQSYSNRFVVTKTADRQEFYRSYDDARPIITDSGDRLATKSADRATAKDMADLAAHRGWQGLAVKGHEDFRREVWIEATAQGIKVTGYKPTERDIEEANRRMDRAKERSIERTDTPDRTADTKGQDPTDRTTATKGQDAARTSQAPAIAEERVDYGKGVRGTIMEAGARPYMDREGGNKSPYIRLQLDNGKTQDVWGVALPDTMERNNLKVGDTITLHSPGTEEVIVKTRDEKTGKLIEKPAQRRAWEAADIQRGPDHSAALANEERSAVIEPADDFNQRAAAAAAAKAKTAERNETPQEEQQRLDQERRNAERKARERDGGRGL